MKLLFFAVMIFSVAHADGLLEKEVHLKKSVEIASQNVCLNDLVEDSWLQGRCEIDKGQCCRWSLGGALFKTYKRFDIQREVAKMNLGGFQVKLMGDETVQVVQTRRELSIKEIQAKIANQRPGLHAITIKVSSPILVSLNEESSWDVVLPENLAARASVKVVSTEDASHVLGWAQAELEFISEAYVAKRTLHANSKVSKEDFTLKKTDILSTQASGLIQKDQFPENMRLRQTVMAGAALTTAAVEKVPLVQLGDMVTLILRADNLKISTKAVVQGPAAIGDMVTVQLSRYNRTFRGKLLEGRLVEVWL